MNIERKYLTQAVINELNNIREFAHKKAELDERNESFFTYDEILRKRVEELKELF
tara:strand:- start:193 stop:357 length:165 start_codon:yes stop_codon:yes gene_type:complete